MSSRPPSPNARAVAPEFTPAPVALLALNWLIPGLGFFLRGRWARGATQALLVGLTLAGGVALHGGVGWPTWSLNRPDFNLINNLTFLIQMGMGAPAIASLAAHWADWTPLGGQPAHAYYELGGYFLVVAGAVNYFSTCSFHDRLCRAHPPTPERDDEREEAAS